MRRRLSPEVRARAASRRRRTRDRKGMTKEDKLQAREYRLHIKDNPCFYCGDYALEMHTDHFYALARGGTSHWHNLVRACAPCNYAKRSKCGVCFLTGAKCLTRCRPPAASEFPKFPLRVSLIGRSL